MKIETARRDVGENWIVRFSTTTTPVALHYPTANSKNAREFPFRSESTPVYICAIVITQRGRIFTGGTLCYFHFSPFFPFFFPSALPVLIFLRCFASIFACNRRASLIRFRISMLLDIPLILSRLNICRSIASLYTPESFVSSSTIHSNVRSYNFVEGFLEIAKGE